jgi:uncharacterized membrane protein YuzA (DUF378 family)
MAIIRAFFDSIDPISQLLYQLIQLSGVWERIYTCANAFHPLVEDLEPTQFN